MAFTLRPYQRESLAAIATALESNQSTLVVLPTGAGKTVVFAALAKQYVDTFSRRVMVCIHRDELARQAAEKITRTTGLACDIEMGERWADSGFNAWRAPVVIASVQTLAARYRDAKRLHRFAPSDFGLVISDEAHHDTTPMFRAPLDHFRQNPECKVVGFTATPNRHDEEALGQIFQSVAYERYIMDMVSDGWLVPIEQRCCYVEGFDLAEVKASKGELNVEQTNRVCERDKVLLGFAGAIHAECGERKTLVFTQSVKQAQKLAEILNRPGGRIAEWISGETHPTERRSTLMRYEEGEFSILCQCDIATEGFDVPNIEFVVMAKPTKSKPKYTQMLGRATRPLPGIVDGIESNESQLQLGFDGAVRAAEIRRQRIAESAKPRAIILDFVGNSGRHKLMSATDALAGNYSDDVIAIVKREEQKANGKPTDVAERLRLAAERLKREAEEAERHKHIHGKARYRTEIVSVFGGSFSPLRVPGWGKRSPPTDKQSAYLERHGLGEATTKREASELIDRHKQLSLSIPCSEKQGNVLRRAGFPANLNKADATKLMAILAVNKWRLPVGMDRPEFETVNGVARIVPAKPADDGPPDPPAEYPQYMEEYF